MGWGKSPHELWKERELRDLTEYNHYLLNELYDDRFGNTREYSSRSGPMPFGMKFGICAGLSVFLFYKGFHNPLIFSKYYNARNNPVPVLMRIINGIIYIVPILIYFGIALKIKCE